MAYEQASPDAQRAARPNSLRARHYTSEILPNAAQYYFTLRAWNTGALHVKDEKLPQPPSCKTKSNVADEEDGGVAAVNGGVLDKTNATRGEPVL